MTEATDDEIFESWNGKRSFKHAVRSVYDLGRSRSAERIAELERQVDGLLRETALARCELDAHQLRLAQTLGLVYQPEGHAESPAEWESLHDGVAALKEAAEPDTDELATCRRTLGSAHDEIAELRRRDTGFRYDGETVVSSDEQRYVPEQWASDMRRMRDAAEAGYKAAEQRAKAAEEERDMLRQKFDRVQEERCEWAQRSLDARASLERVREQYLRWNRDELHGDAAMSSLGPLLALASGSEQTQQGETSCTNNTEQTSSTSPAAGKTPRETSAQPAGTTSTPSIQKRELAGHSTHETRPSGTPRAADTSTLQAEQPAGSGRPVCEACGGVWGEDEGFNLNLLRIGVPPDDVRGARVCADCFKADADGFPVLPAALMSAIRSRRAQPPSKPACAACNGTGKGPDPQAGVPAMLRVIPGPPRYTCRYCMGTGKQHDEPPRLTEAEREVCDAVLAWNDTVMQHAGAQRLARALDRLAAERGK